MSPEAERLVVEALPSVVCPVAVKFVALVVARVEVPVTVILVKNELSAESVVAMSPVVVVVAVTERLVVEALARVVCPETVSFVTLVVASVELPFTKIFPL